MTSKTDEKIEERIQEILQEEIKRERVNKIIPVALIGIIGILLVAAVVGVFYKTLSNSADVQVIRKKEHPVTVRNLKTDREKFDLYFNPKFSEIAGKADFIDSWFLNEEKDKLSIRVKKNWYKIEPQKKILALKVLRDQFDIIYSSSELAKISTKSPVVNLIDYNGNIIAVCDKDGAFLK